ncbi:MAG: N-glycosylase/DNA lyase [archaeon]
MDFKKILETYPGIEKIIESKFSEFKKILLDSNERIFSELAFCLLTPQSKARVCWEKIERLAETKLLFCGGVQEIYGELKGIRFRKRKAEYIVEARNFFSENGKLKIKEKLREFNDIFELRDWLVKSVKGFGYKEASHFLRNIGLGANFAILDRHVLRMLKKIGLIKSIPVHLSRKTYLEIEEKMRVFSKKIKIPLSHLDFVFWYLETKDIFK